MVADARYAVLGLLSCCQHKRLRVTLVTRLRLDAALYEPAPERKPGQTGRPRKKGKRLPMLAHKLGVDATPWTPITVAHWYSRSERQIEIVSDTAVWYHSGMPLVPIRWVLIRDPQGKFEPQALLCTDLEAAPEQVVAWFVSRWQVEATFQQVRTHLGVETQRQWNDQAIARTTPAFFGLFSLVTLLAHPHMDKQPARQAAWYSKGRPTFSDALALVRRRLWRARFCMSCLSSDMQKPLRAWLEPLTEALCYAT